MTDERAVRDNADEIKDQSQIQGDQGQPEQEAADPPREAPPRGARPGDEGARLLRRVLQLQPAGVDGDLSSYSFHMADQGTDAMEREKAFLFASQEGRYLWHVNQALRRLFQAPEKF